MIMKSSKESFLAFGIVIENMDPTTFIADYLGYDFINKLCMEVGATAEEVEAMKRSDGLIGFFENFKSFLSVNHDLEIDLYDDESSAFDDVIIYYYIDISDAAKMEKSIALCRSKSEFETFRLLADQLGKNLEFHVAVL